jgi:hypothetical protein
MHPARTACSRAIPCEDRSLTARGGWPKQQGSCRRRQNVVESAAAGRSGGAALRQSTKNAFGSFWPTLCLASALSGCFGCTVAAQPAPRPSLTVTPSSPIDISGAQGGPFSPPSIQYHLTASTGTIKFAITPPFWLTADPRAGSVGVDGTTVTLSVNAQALKLAPRAYQAPVTFTNVTNGQGTTSRTAKLTVQGSATPSQGYLLDESGGYLRDNRGERLIAR